ncbi:MAG TPA: hypothetical protein VFW83_08345 [Bryobacteraceae bacterium]|nr:hypothetical protein [Bryobacteraceae bacterium]
MPASNPQRTIHVLLQKHGRTFTEETGIDPELGSPQALFSLLCVSLLCSARIGHRNALNASKALLTRGWSTPRKLAASTWKQRVEALDAASYVRYDERTATMLGETAQMVLDDYRGDLRNLREAAGRVPSRERELLKKFKGIGDVGADIFFREVQIAWTELFPFADSKALDTAKALGLPRDPAALAKLARGRLRYTQLVAALVRTRLERDIENIRGTLRSAA